MVGAKILLVCILVLQCDVTSAAKVNYLKHFEVSEVESEQGTKVNQVEQPAPAADETIPPPVISSAKDAVGLYKLSYEDYGETWEQWKQDHNRVYDSADEEKKRFAIFMDRVKMIERHNWEFHNGLTTYWMGINQFSDWTNEEFRSILSPRMVSETANTQASPPEKDVEVPASIDWRTKGYVTSIQDQKACNACWAFSATGAIEGQWFKKTGKLISLSKQQLVDCSTSYGNRGCGSGGFENAFMYIMSIGGITSENVYPYKAKNGTCHYKTKTRKASIVGFTDVASGSEMSLKSAVGSVGPVSVAVAVSQRFRDHKGGIFIDNNCTEINHDMLVVGYGTELSQDYWLVKNSWGTKWGEKGYIKMARNRRNMCEIATMARYPKV